MAAGTGPHLHHVTRVWFFWVPSVFQQKIQVQNYNKQNRILTKMKSESPIEKKYQD